LSNAQLEQCKKYYASVQWGQELSKAYRTRAAINEFLIYVAAAIGIIGGTIVTTLAATDQTDSDVYKATPPITAGLAVLAALGQSDEKAEAYTLTAIANEEAMAAVARYLSSKSTKTENDYRVASETLTDALLQERANLDKRMIAIVKKRSAQIGAVRTIQPTTLSSSAPADVVVFIDNVDVVSRKEEIHVHLHGGSQSRLFGPGELTVVPPNAIKVTVPAPTACEEKILTVTVGKELLLPPKTLRCQQ